MDKTILVTGCAGFIGSHLTHRLLELGYSVIGIDNFDAFYSRSIKEHNMERFSKHPSFGFYEIDICQPNAFNKIQEKIDLVIHLAAKAGVLPSIKNPEEYVQTNIIGTHNLLEFMKTKSIKKMVFASSSSVYGNNKKIPFLETDITDYPISPYAFSKKTCELMNFNYHYIYKIDILNLRFFTVYGPGQRPDLAIHKFVELIDKNKPIELYGDGSTARDYTFIEDNINGVIKAMNYLFENDNIFEIVNLGNRTPVRLIDLAHTIYKQMNKAPNLLFKPMQPGDVDITYANIDKAFNLFGYAPVTSIDMGIRKFIDWYNSKK